MRITHRRLRHVTSMLLSLLAAATLAGCHDDGGPPPAPVLPRAPDVAVTAKGSIQAVDRVGLRSYFAIPFAKPPVGALRWQAPQAPDAFGTIAKTQSAAPCLQTSASPFRLAGDSEDCLYLDVHAPTGSGPFPVMVWIHGGAFNTGGTTTYADPSPLVSKGAIVVTVAYRLGALGFLAHPALADSGGAAGNYGIMDQQAALKWVQDNIATFAGDPTNVTIFGESAGGMSVMTNLASPLSRGLFAKAIVESGAYSVNGQLTLAQSQTVGTLVVNNTLAAAGLTCATVDAACLRALPDAVVRNQLATAFNAAQASPVPTIDGKVLPKSIKATFVAGENNKVPLINGTNEDEYALFIAIGELGRRAAATPPNADPTNTSFSLSAAAYPATAAGLASGTGVPTAALTGTFYPLANYGSVAALQPSLAASALGTDVIFACNGLNVSTRASSQGTPTWMYEFRDQTAPPSIGNTNGAYTLSFPQGAAHSYEIQYLFNLGNLQNDERRALQTAMSTYWTNFARSGNPASGGTVPAWGRFDTGALQGLDVASGGGITARTPASFSTQHQCATVWTALTF